MKFDQLLFRKINDVAGESNLSDWVGIFGARYLVVVIIASLLKYVFIYKDKAERRLNLKVVWNALFSAAVAVGVSWIIALIVERPRPFELGLGVNIYGAPWTVWSFPSTHTAISFAIAMAVFLTYWRFGSFLLFLAAIVGISRIYVGVHYPMDVLAGAFVGIAAAYLVVKLFTLAILKMIAGEGKKKIRK